MFSQNYREKKNTTADEARGTPDAQVSSVKGQAHMKFTAFSSIAALAFASVMTLTVETQAQGMRNNVGSSGVGGRAVYNEPPPVHGARERNLGGGFIEFLVTGRDPTPRARAWRPGQDPERAQAAPLGSAPVQARASVPALQPGEAGVIMAEIPGRNSRNARSSGNPQLAALQQPAPQRRAVVAGHGIAPEFRRQVVDYSGRHAPGTIVVDTGRRFLYLVEPGGKAIRYGVGVGREGFSWKGTETLTRKAQWPSWRPPEAMLRRQPDLPRFMEGGPDNPLGARALYLGSTLYRIHGTNEPHTIGQAMSSGCIRMLNEDVIDLYNRVRVGAKVVVM